MEFKNKMKYKIVESIFKPIRAVERHVDNNSLKYVLSEGAVIGIMLYIALQMPSVASYSALVIVSMLAVSMYLVACKMCLDASRKQTT